MTRNADRSSPARNARALAGAMVMALALAGCDTVRQTVGLENDPPDEFSVVVRAPLSMPRDFGLKAPQPGTTRPQDERLRDRTRQIVLDSEGKGRTARAAPARIDGLSPAEARLLAKLHADQIDPNIRQVVERETTVMEEESKNFVEGLLFWKKPAPPGKVVDPLAERRRLQENTALGRTPTSGETPQITRKKKGGLLQGIF